MRFSLIFLLFYFFYSCTIVYSQNLSGWYELQSPTSQLLNKVFFIDSSMGWIGGDSGTILRTTDGGINWEEQYTAPNTYLLDMFFLNSRFGWVLYWDDIPPIESKMLITQNGGEVWNKVSCPGVNPFFLSVCFVDSLTGFLAGPPFLKTTDGGINWYQTYVYDVDTLPPDLSHLLTTKIEFINDTQGYACGGRRDLAGVMWKTNDRGESWAAIGLSADEIYDIHIFDSLTVNSIAGDPEGFFPVLHITTNDGGVNWIAEELNFYGSVSAMTYRTPAEGWAAIADKFIVTTDSGNTWNEYPVPGDIFLLDMIFIDSITGYAAGSDGHIFKYKEDVISGTDTETRDIPVEFAIQPNYPNPFNPVTTIEYKISSASYVELIVYDLLGRKLKTLVDKREEPGYYKVKFDASEMVSGIYLCTLKAGVYSKSIKMVLMR